MLKYLHHSNQFQTQLVDFQKELLACGRLPYKDRVSTLTQWEEKVKARHAELNKLEVPPRAAKYHEHLNGMFQALEDYGQENLTTCSPEKLQQAATRWKEELESVNKELDSLHV